MSFFGDQQGGGNYGAGYTPPGAPGSYQHPGFGVDAPGAQAQQAPQQMQAPQMQQPPQHAPQGEAASY